MVILNSIRGISNNDQTITTNSVVARTNDGIKIIVDFSVEYKLGTQPQPAQLLSQLLSIYNSVGYNWSTLIIKIQKICPFTIYDS